MRASILDILACPACKAFPLELSQATRKSWPWEWYLAHGGTGSSLPQCEIFCAQHGRRIEKTDSLDTLGCQVCTQVEIVQGVLHCNGCAKSYPIVDGIPSFVETTTLKEQNGDADSIQILREKEKEYRDKNWWNYENVFSPSTNYYEINSVVDELGPTVDDRVLEVGAGTGRVSRAIAARSRELVCIDYSLNSLKYLRSRAGILGANVHVVHADARYLPFRAGIFNKSISSQVFQSLPRQTVFKDALAEIQRVLGSSGIFVISLYNYSLYKQIQARRYPALANNKGWLQEGIHADAVYYYNFSANNLVSLLGNYFAVSKCYGLLLPFAGRARGLGTRIERSVRSTPLSLWLGHLVVARCENDVSSAQSSLRQASVNDAPRVRSY